VPERIGATGRCGFTSRWVSMFVSTVTLAAALVLGLQAGTPAAGAAGTTWYAYAKGAATSPTSCPQSTTASQQCTLAQALSLAKAGDTVALATPGGTAHYVGNWTVNPAGTSSSAPLTIEPAAGVSSPVLDGNHGRAAACGTSACNGTVLTVGTPPGPLSASGAAPAQAGTPALNVFLQIQGVTVEYANSVLSGSTGGEAGGLLVSKGANVTATNDRFLRNHADGDGAAIDNPLGGTVTVSNSTFLANSVTSGGGAVDNGVHGNGTLTVTGSTFSLNSAAGGGAIENAFEGSGTVTVAGSTFSHNTADIGGGAIDSGTSGVSTLTVSSSTFVGNVATSRAQVQGGGGAIDIAGGGAIKATYAVAGSTFVANSSHYGGAINLGAATGTVSGSSFSANGASYGGAIANGIIAGGGGPLAVTASTFSANRAAGNGGAIDNGEATGPGTLTVSASTFWGNAAVGNAHAAGVNSSATNGDGGAIDNADNGGLGTVVLSASTFSGNVAKHAGGAVANEGTVFVAADILNGSCYQSSIQTKWSDAGYNVGSNATCLKGGTSDVSHGAGRLGPLARTGGSTRTMPPLASNPAVGIVPLNTTVTLDGTSATLCPTTDQRGVASAPGKACNAGAVQAGS